MTTNSAAYLRAVESTNEVDSPAVGIGKTRDYPTNQRLVEAIFKQNNTLIELIVRLDQKITEVQQNVRTLQKDKQVVQPNISEAISELSAKLAGVTITGEKGKDPIKATTAPYYVFKNPRVIFDEEKSKK